MLDHATEFVALGLTMFRRCPVRISARNTYRSL